jgi:uncharacterized protein (TIRG00374 family)
MRRIGQLDIIRNGILGGGYSALLRALLSGGLIAGMIYLAGPERIWRSLSHMDPGVFLLACGVFAIGQVMAALRWRVVLRSLRDNPPGLWFIIGLNHIGEFLNFFLPSTMGGDVARAEMAKSYSGGRSGSYVAVLFDRFSAFIAVVLIGTCAVCLSYVGIGWFDWQVALLSFLFVAITIAVFVVLETSLAQRVLDLLDRRPLAKFVAILRNILSLLQGCAANKPMLFRIVGLALLIQFCLIVVVHLLSVALGLKVEFYFHFIAIPVITLVTLLPISLNGLGVREILFVLLYSKVGVPSEMALALSFSWTLVLVLFALYGGLCLQFPSIYRFFEDQTSEAEPRLRGDRI